MAVKFLDLRKQTASLRAEIEPAIARILENATFIGGDEVERFEQEFGTFVGASALGVGNGTDALEIAIQALNLPKDSEVLLPANTFAASAEAVARNQLRLVFVDCDNTYTMDIADLERKITPQTSAIMAVHLYGQSADMHAICTFAKQHNLHIIEDCAQAHGATFAGQKVGTFGEVACFSFYPGKNLGAYGDAGAIVSKDSALLRVCRQIAHHGGLQKYEHTRIGRNSRLDSLQAAVLRVKLPHLNAWNAQRDTIAREYMRLLADTKGLVLPQLHPQAQSVWHLFVVRILGGKRDFVRQRLAETGIETGLHYPKALPSCAAYQNVPFVRASATSNACAWESEILSLPMGEHLDISQAREVADALRAALAP
ncbi:MAG: DegT/DnrJ/EryC1/StrS family aminotransferase [Helicobacter sp.]|nr:DegT/DnrJ/EryC1/StrS family aminotransferase [Helicobacter sp.]